MLASSCACIIECHIFARVSSLFHRGEHIRTEFDKDHTFHAEIRHLVR